MVGFLCSRKNVRLFARYLQETIKPRNYKIPALIFSISDINLSDRTVKGILVDEDRIAPLRAGIPPLIFNFGLQHAKSSVKKLRNLMEMENVTLINPVNAFDQWSVMKMLTSNLETKQYILPYVDITVEIDRPDFGNIGNFMVRPQHGSNLAKHYFCRKENREFAFYDIGGNTSSASFSIQSKIDDVIKKGNWMLLLCPELTMENNMPLIVRSFLQKSANGRWKIILKTIASPAAEVNKETGAEIDADLLRIMECINNFIPELAFCCIDFIFTKNGSPYFLGLGGWQNLIFGEAQHKVLFESLCRNISRYAENLE